MDLGLGGKAALVLGSSQGLGLGVARLLAAEGADVILTGRQAERLEEESARINKGRSGRAAFVVADLKAAEARRSLVAAAKEKFGSVDILVSNTGGPAPGAASAVTAATWRDEFESMALPAFEITPMPGMRAQKWGRIITIASSGVVQPIPNLSVSNALRSSLVAWMKTLSFEVAGDGITVNVIVPGRIGTDRVAQLDKNTATQTGKPLDEVIKTSHATIPLGRYGRIEEFASAVAFIAGQPSSYVTGSIVRVDGGMIRSL
jgi:3-oxoacyl-[acyl-carrier protein] reductase